MNKQDIQTVLDALEYIKLHVPFSDEDGTMYSESAIAILTAALAEPEGEPSTVLRLIDTIKYLVGIAERGEGRKARDDELPEQFVLGYVKRLEAALAEPSEPVATIEISERGTSRTIDTHFAYCVRDWPCGEYELFTHPAKPEPSEPDCSPNHLCNGRMVHLPNGEQCDKCGETP